MRDEALEHLGDPVDHVVLEGALEHDDAGPVGERAGDLGPHSASRVVIGHRVAQRARCVEQHPLRDRVGMWVVGEVGAGAEMVSRSSRWQSSARR